MINEWKTVVPKMVQGQGTSLLKEVDCILVVEYSVFPPVCTITPNVMEISQIHHPKALRFLDPKMTG